ncbi:MAG: twin-arginine translocase TatA/TatE family subunit [Candidatus Hydrogenedentes bacterium]|nr:twin-arginine translocase TatA/TatE family subunit [Candidatus Hydrogenedentota bacterium]
MYMPGVWELIIVLFIVLVIFGAGKLPQVGKSLGSAINEFRSSVRPDDDKDDGDSDAPKE